MNYSTQTPTVDGYYWCATSNASSWNPAQIVEIKTVAYGDAKFQYITKVDTLLFTQETKLTRMRLDEFLALQATAHGFGTQWAGPIAQPESAQQDAK